MTPIEKKELKGFNHGYILQLGNPNYLDKYLQMSNAMSHYHSGVIKGAEYCRDKFPAVKKQWEILKSKRPNKGMSL